jgi:hypothetical protein
MRHKRRRERMAMQRWEYRVVRGELSEPRLNELGQQGWELVGMHAGAHGVSAYLKRPVLPFKEQVTLEQRQKYARLEGYDLTSAADAVAEELP